MTGDDVAVLVVHGVSDQPRGETALAVARVIAGLVKGDVRAVDVTVPVSRVFPVLTFPSPEARGFWAGIKRAWVELNQSDFLIAARTYIADRPLDLGALFTDYLFWKARHGTSDPGPPKDSPTHQASCFEVRGSGKRVDVFEMYWADLSRLSGAAGRIVSELYTLVFNFSRLGANTVALTAAVREKGWWLGLLSWSHRHADWLYLRVYVLVALQLTVTGILIIATTFDSDKFRPVATAVVIALWMGILAGRILVPDAAWLARYRVLAGVLTVLIATSWFTPAWRVLTMLALLFLLLGLQERLYDLFERRFRGVYRMGVFFACIGVAAGVWDIASIRDPTSFEPWVVGALRVADVMLLLMMLFWLWMAIVLICMFVAGIVCSMGQREVRRAVNTGLMGFALSFGAYMAWGMAVWMAAADLLARATGEVHYRPIAMLLPGDPLAAKFLTDRQASATMLFSLIAASVAFFLLALLIVNLPSILVELRLVRSRSVKGLSRWLTRGSTFFERSIPWLAAFFLFVLIGGTVVTALRVVYRASGIEPERGLASLIAHLDALSGVAQAWIVYPLLGATTGLIAAGGFALKTLRALRIPMDVALDVDNHFREFPRRAIPRVQIFERYIAELDLILARGYGKLVIVAHSQGTVITAELLRYLKQRSDARLVDNDPLDQLRSRWARTNVLLLTLGCPLRQLYAQRFPDMYGWVVEPCGPGRTGPSPAALGISEWRNRWGAGDYVGRWLWDPYDEFEDRDHCIGADAHTHYFDPDQHEVKNALKDLIMK